MKKWISWCLLCWACALAAEEKYDLIPEKSEVNSILATVNGDPVSLGDVLPLTRQVEFQAYAAYSGQELKDAIRNIRKRVLDDIIDRKLIVLDYEEKPFEITEQDLDTQIDDMASRMGYNSRSEFIRQLRLSGTTLEKVRKDVKENMIVQLMMVNRVRFFATPTPKEVNEYYEANKEKFDSPEKIELGLLLIDNRGGDNRIDPAELAKTLKADPAQFAVLARKYSAGPGASSGGNLGWIERRKLRPEFQKELQTFQKNDVRGPLVTADGIAFIKVIDHKPAQNGDVAKIYQDIKKRLENERAKGVQEEYIKKLRKKAIINYYFD